ncbi:hypothetical protein MMIC_P2100 [Mariprofundus micogutta]|uniref:Elongation factor-1 alpha n=1 Tax=Mariprofundus micogutta TaxID=1921010 RepID=A0A1L8CQC0_9PROT|nr:hypothetical protein [Mariprofundus micogutta]GAV21120.1 hypothetical protein MMIC_P2100 [Mariprofundus micogutta]
MPHYRRFSDASVSEKILDTMFLITIGLGYLFALAHTYFSHEGRDGQVGLSVEDVKIAYYGEHQQTRLGAALNGGMDANLETPEQKQVIVDWIEGGTDKDEFENKIAPILNNNCIGCHSLEAEMGLPPLTSYEEVKTLTRADTGASVESLVRVSHIHLFGIAFILFFVGRIFILCEMPVMIKRVTVAVPFLAILVDILSWYITKYIPGFAFVVVLAGGLMGISLTIQILVSMYQMWLYKPDVEPIEM